MFRNTGIEPGMHERIPYYATAFTASALGLACFNTVVTSNEFILTAIALILVGFCFSWIVRAGLIQKAASELMMLAVLIAVLAAVLTAPRSREVFLPEQISQSTDMFMGAMLVWMMVACSFRLKNDRALLFMCVPSLSLIGLTATFAPDIHVLFYFGIYLLLGSFVLVKENVFSYQSEISRSIGRVRFSPGNTKIHIGLTASVTLVAMVVGITLGTLLYPKLVASIARPLAPFDASSIAEQMVSEDYVPVAQGPAILSDQELMVVRANEPTLWRGTTYNKYTGQGWANELGPAEYKWINPLENVQGQYSNTIVSTFVLPKNPLYEIGKSTRKIEQTFTVVSGHYRTVFAAAQPLSIKLRLAKSNHPYGSRIPIIRFGNRIESGTVYGINVSYTALSRVNTATVRQLSQAGQNYPEIIKSRYLSVPETTWQAQKLAKQISANEPDPYRKALAIRDHLEHNYTYDTRAIAAPANEDAISYFLFKSKRGYCDIFASSMVIMARQIGIPARWVTGFAPASAPDKDGLFHVKAKDRHAWAELYFPGYGWVEFDATPSAEPDSFRARLNVLRTLLATDRTTLILSLIILILLGYLLKSEVIDRIVAAKRARRPSPEAAISTQISKQYKRMCSLLSKAGYTRKYSTTPSEYATLVTKNMGSDLNDLSTAVDAVTADLVEFRYSPREPSADRVVAMSRTIDRIARLLKTARKANLLPQKQTS